MLITDPYLGVYDKQYAIEMLQNNGFESAGYWNIASGASIDTTIAACGLNSVMVNLNLLSATVMLRFTDITINGCKHRNIPKFCLE